MFSPDGTLISASAAPHCGALKQHLQSNKCILVHKVVHSKSPAYLRQLPHAGTSSNVNSSNSILGLPKTRIDLYKMSFSYFGSYCWNMLPNDLENTCSIDTFKYKILQHFCSDCDMRQSDCSTLHITIPLSS